MAHAQLKQLRQLLNMPDRLETAWQERFTQQEKKIFCTAAGVDVRDTWSTFTSQEQNSIRATVRRWVNWASELKGIA